MHMRDKTCNLKAKIEVVWYGIIRFVLSKFILQSFKGSDAYSISYCVSVDEVDEY